MLAREGDGGLDCGSGGGTLTRCNCPKADRVSSNQAFRSRHRPMRA